LNGKGPSDDGTLPTVHREAGLRFQFFASDRLEPPHVHVRGRGGRAKISLLPSAKVQKADDYSRSELGDVIRIAEAHREEWLAAWRDYFAES